MTLASCGDSLADYTRDPGEPMTIRGVLGAGFRAATTDGKASRSIGSAVTHIGSIPIIAGSVDIGQMQGVPIGDDGAFNITVTPGGDESDMLLLYNPTATALEEKAAGFVSLRAADGADLVVFPLFSARRDLDFGSVDLAEGIAVSQESLESQEDSFSLSFDQLMETAYHDNLFKHVKNLYVNRDRATGQEYIERTQNYFTEAIASAQNAWLPVETWAHTSGFNIRIDAFSPSDHDYDDVVSGVVDIEIVPPTGLTVKNTAPPVAFSPDSPLSLAYLRSTQGGYAPWIAPLPEGTPGSYIVGFDCEEDPPNGVWRVNAVRAGGRAEKALFDMEAASPFTPAPERAFMYYIPSIMLSVGADGRLAAVDLRWYAWNPAVRAYGAIGDLTTFLRLAQAFTTTITKKKDNGDGTFTYNYANENWNNVTRFVPAGACFVGSTAPEGELLVERIDIVYQIAGVLYRFTLFDNP